MVSVLTATVLRAGSIAACAALLGTGWAAPSFAQTPEEADAEAQAILEKADQIRFPPGGFEASISIDIAGSSEAITSRKYRLLSKGAENAVVMATEPASERGQIMLLKGRELWVFLPNLSQPVRLSLSQRLTGQVSNGDLARANFTGDYKPKLLRTEAIDGEPMHVLELSAVDRGVTYHRVLLWVRKSNNRPIKAEFYSVSDRLLKTCTYEGYKRIAGAVRPTRLVMRDGLKPDEQSVLEYTEIKPRDIPDRVFTKDYLKRLE